MQRLIDVYGINEDVVEIWRQEESDTLLEIQSDVVEKYGLFEGTNLLITAPSSSGKTFIGEMAAVKSYFDGKKTIFLVPMKAIAEEKFIDFKNKYGKFGLKIVISTHDRTEYDELINAGHFDIAIIIYEKMNILLTQNIALLNSCGLIVIDELQLLNEKSRGSELEILLTKIKMIKEKNDEKFQYLGLSAVLGDLKSFDTWLNATRSETKNRPLELHEIVLYTDGKAKCKCFNNQSVYEFQIDGISSINVPTDSPINWRQAQLLEETIQKRLIVLCNYYLGQGKKILIFRKWRNLARDTATNLTQQLSIKPATNAIRELGGLESSNIKDALTQCLSGGIAFHNSDLPIEARFVIEKDFRNSDGQIQIICATSTLAMGVNLPSSVVIIADTLKIDPNAGERFHEIPLTTSEYKNMSGRAGRTRYGEEGISLLLANSRAEAAKYWGNYVNGKLDNIIPPLKNQNLRKTMLSLIAGQICNNISDIIEFLLSSYTGYVSWNRDEKIRDSFIKTLEENIDFLLKNELVKIDDDSSIHATKLGKLCSISGVEIDTFVMLQKALNNIDPIHYDFWEIIFPCLHCVELSETIRIYLACNENEGGELFKALDELEPNKKENLCNWSMKTINSRLSMLRRIKAFLMLDMWLTGIEMRRIEDRFTRFLSGTIVRIAETTSWMVDTIRKIAYTLDYSNEFVSEMSVLSERLSRGVPSAGIELHKLEVQGLNRPLIKRLVDSGLGSLDKILDTQASDFGGTISPRVAQRIHEAIIKNYEESLERAKYIQAHRLEKLGIDPKILVGIYEQEGIPLEVAVVDLLNAPKLELGAERVTDQKQGEPDILIALKEGILVGSVTASKSNVSDSKCAEIIRSGAAYNPTSFIVFGRPGFHELALRNAPHINRQLEQGKSYKLFPINELGELYVRIQENKLSRDQFIDILLNWKGLIESNLTSVKVDNNSSMEI